MPAAKQETPNKLTSRKLWVAILAIVATVVLTFRGLEADQAAGAIWKIAAAYIGGQAIVDTGWGDALKGAAAKAFKAIF